MWVPGGAWQPGLPGAEISKNKGLAAASVSTQSVRDLRESSVPEQGSTEVF